ncbi:hypothetical protein E4U28_000784, partial [Claviceps purpurea]
SSTINWVHVALYHGNDWVPLPVGAIRQVKEGKDNLLLYDMSPMIHHWRSRSEAISTQLEALKSLWLTE